MQAIMYSVSGPRSHLGQRDKISNQFEGSEYLALWVQPRHLALAIAGESKIPNWGDEWVASKWREIDDLVV
jgi:hypothetical protein